MNFFQRLIAAILGFFKKPVEVKRPEPKAEPAKQETPVVIKPVETPKPVVSHPPVFDFAAALVSRACADVGKVMETDGPNRSPDIDKINQIMGVPLGSPYCIGGLWVNLDRVCKANGILNPVPKEPATQAFIKLNSVQSWIRPRGVLGKKGDWAIFRHIADHAHGHATMLMEDQKSYPLFKTVEYNTNQAGSRDGQGTFLQSRSEEGSQTLEFQGFVDICGWVKGINK